jgi:hypothetical protein
VIDVTDEQALELYRVAHRQHQHTGDDTDESGDASGEATEDTGGDTDKNED